MNEINDSITSNGIVLDPLGGNDTAGGQLALKKIQPPENIPEPELEKAKSMAIEVARKIMQAPDNRTYLREVSRIGENIQTRANSHFKLMRTSLDTVMKRMAKGDNKSIPADLMRLRGIMDEINPYSAMEQIQKGQKAGFFSRLLGRVPGVGKILKDIAVRYESVQTQVDAIIQSLEAGADKLLENSLEIEEGYKNLKVMQKELQLRGYQLQVILTELEKLQPQVTDDLEKQTLQKGIAKIVRRLQNLKVTENAFAQFFITMNVTMDNHENLREAVMSMTHLTRPVLENGLALKIAQQEERQIADALSASQDYLGNLMVNIAEDSMDNAKRTAEVVNQPLVHLKDLTKAYQTLMDRMNEAAEIESKMVDAARQNIVQLDQMTTELEKQAQAQESAREAL